MSRGELGFLADPALRAAALRRALRVTHRAADAEDAVQDAAVRALRSAATFRHGAAGAPWFLTIVNRASIDLAARRARDERALIAPPDAADPGAESVVLRNERRAAVRRALSQLPPEQRRVVVLHDLDGETTRAIAARDAVPHSTVRTRLRRGRHLLRTLLVEPLSA